MSDTFRRFVAEIGPRDTTLGELVKALGDRSLLVAIVLFSLPNCIPAPPGIGSVFAVPVLVVTWQLLRDYPALRLPGGLAQRRISARVLGWLASKGLGPLIWIERRCSPRMPWLVSRLAHRWIGGAILVLATVVAFPGPMTNFLPALAILSIAVGLLERDGLIVLGGLLFGIVAIVVSLSASAALFGAAYLAVEHFLLR
ncbi:MAG: exopolysaccharide biosynthesis protein [Rhodospirillales bacterium]|nr:exopolysaccharide biosynthesis protein [Rhodospirillales bacterium]